MTINGRDIKFLRTVGANCALADRAPDGDLNRFIREELMNPNYSTAQKTAAFFMVCLNTGYEMAKGYEDKGYKPNPVTEAELLCLLPEDFQKLFDECMTAFYGEKITVQTQPPKGKKTATAKKAAPSG